MNGHLHILAHTSSTEIQKLTPDGQMPRDSAVRGRSYHLLSQVGLHQPQISLSPQRGEQSPKATDCYHITSVHTITIDFITWIL